jgi:hypothetical protein
VFRIRTIFVRIRNLIGPNSDLTPGPDKIKFRIRKLYYHNTVIQKSIVKAAFGGSQGYALKGQWHAIFDPLVFSQTTP